MTPRVILPDKNHLGMIHEHMRRRRLIHPQIYAAAVMAERARQVAERRQQAVGEMLWTG
jgi:hypothetical protein